MTVNTWIIAVDSKISDLVGAARTIAGTVRVAAIGDQHLVDEVADCGVDAVLWFQPAADQVAESLAGQVAHTLADRGADVVLCGPQAAARLIAGRLAATLGAPLLTSVQSIDPDPIAVRRLAVGGSVEQTATALPLLAVFDSSGSAMEHTTAAAPVETVAAIANPALRLVSAAPRQTGADLGSADRVVAAGRGLAAKSDLELIQNLARSLGAQVGGSLPLAEDLGWLDTEQCIGISGQQISPALYVAVGISGQMQHMAGVRRAQTVVAINNDPDALIFGKCDFGIVGDLYQIVPALISTLQAQPA